ncbi:SMI1/KNR4 family protein [Streptomyces sp. NPDC051001]|uniref:SMI1/KNR4 family protein n=1 Tax=Streptomyces sp. NPDC051001 TaxID=3155795 RepID=UPI0034474A08
MGRTRRDGSTRRLYMPFDALLFFGDNGGGDHFAFVQRPQRPDIFVWEHESDSRRWVAGDLRRLVSAVFAGIDSCSSRCRAGAVSGPVQGGGRFRYVRLRRRRPATGAPCGLAA